MAGDAATDKIAGIGTASVREASGGGWAGWLEALDAAGADEISRPESVRLYAAWDEEEERRRALWKERIDAPEARLKS
ncbi:MAG: hypothetical protein GWM92_18715 [Gemmatimonadetes bacterium]|nr:hypothetical protein [Gemmatimonadota bacterium]NIR80828.1 hypothetical protein [Gemmatimonadota bacterium]NIT89648.1 hypothetical protein [Gemmatimonadota bacterium]NIU33425.1 hypothetical protein [Gemmatimonadota bacterium]NIU37720.1 hypothetical protein [Gemmatimonadota bacterium]